MDPDTLVHYRIQVYDDAPPPAMPSSVTLCPGERQNRRARFAIEVPQVTCRRCLQLLDVIGLRPIAGYTPPAPD